VDLTHADLVDWLRSGDPDSLAWVVSTHQSALLEYARRLLNDSSEAEDIVQEAFIRLWRRRKLLRPDGSVRSLLFISVRSIARDVYRHWGRRMILEPVCEVPTSGDTPLDHLIGTELNHSFQAVLEGLSPRRREVFHLIRNEGLTHEDTGKELGITTRTVKNTITSALSEIRTKLDGFR
jgi:RNA polymerase sigma-70 factor (ECF subfamily)